LAEEMLGKLKSIDTTLLAEIVQQDQRDASFKITEWSVRRLSNKGIANPDGLWLFSGTGIGSKGIQPWSVVLKILVRQNDEPPLDNHWHWKREFLLAQSELINNLAGPVKGPRIFHSEETSDGAWIWMEHVEDLHPGPWTLDNYAFAAHQLGIWNGAYLTGTSLPTDNWLAHQYHRSWLSWINFEEDWLFSLNQKYVPNEAVDRCKKLWDVRETFFKVLESLPKVFSHFDCQRRNLMIRRGANQANELVALDWAQCGIGAIGTELNWLVGMGTTLLEWSPSDIVTLDETTFRSYIQGLQDTGWSGDVNIVRLGYVTMLAVFIGCAFPGLTAAWCSTESREAALQVFDFAEEELFWKVLPVLDYSLDRADEARSLMKKLGYQ
jgi:hypothetical protein